MQSWIKQIFNATFSPKIIFWRQWFSNGNDYSVAWKRVRFSLIYNWRLSSISLLWSFVVSRCGRSFVSRCGRSLCCVEGLCTFSAPAKILQRLSHHTVVPSSLSLLSSPTTSCAVSMSGLAGSQVAQQCPLMLPCLCLDRELSSAQREGCGENKEVSQVQRTGCFSTRQIEHKSRSHCVGYAWVM